MPNKTTLAQLSAGAQVAFQNKDLRARGGVAQDQIHNNKTNIDKRQTANNCIK